MRKDRNILLFFLTEKYYYDNSRYFFEFARVKKETKSILFVANKKLYKELINIFPEEVVYAKSFKGFRLFFKSKNVIISYGASAAAFKPYYLHEKCKNIIYMGHGTPVKRIGLQTPVWRKYGKSFQMQKYSYLTACSDVERLMLSSGFDVEMDRVWITGLPRADYLLGDNNKDADLLSAHPYLDKKILLYAPTWREYGYETRFFPFNDFDAQQIEEFLEKNDAYILIRGHKEDIKRKSISDELDIFSIKRVVSAEQENFPDVHRLLPFVDIMITDYSSIMVDYLLLNRPVCFVPYDLEEYNSYKGILLDYERNSPGFKMFTQKDFVNNLQSYLDDPNIHADWRKRVCDMYHHHQNGGSSERIYNKIRLVNNKRILRCNV